MFSPTVQRTALASGFGLVAYADAEVDEGPQAAILSADSYGLEFRVYDPTNTTFLGTLQSRQFGEWTEELNGKGLGRLTALITDQRLARNRKLFQDDNVIRAHFRNSDRFAWRVQAGEDDIITSNEASGASIGLDGPGALDVLEEAIVFPEYPITGDPMKDAPERFFGYMSKKGSTSYQNSAPQYNLVTKPRVTASTDWEIISGASAGSLSVGVDAGINDFDTIRFTYSSTGSTEVYMRMSAASPIPVTPSRKMSMGLQALASSDTWVTMVADFDTGDVIDVPTYVPEGDFTALEFPDILVPPGASEMILGIRIDEGAHISGETVEFFWPMVNRGTSVYDYFDGNTPDKKNFIQAWTGATNASTSSRIIRMVTLANHQPSWYDPAKWTRDFTVVRKSSAKAGTAQYAPDNWADPTAYLLWPSSPVKPSTPGTVYWRNEFTMPKDGAVFLQAAADNQLRVWLDGVEVIAQGFNGDATDITGSWDGVLKKGRHLITAETTNFKSFSPGKNYGWFLASVMYKVNNEPVGVITHTDKTWYSFYQGDTNVPYTDTTTTKKSSKTVTTEKKVPLKYKVRSGDTLIGIARKYGIYWRDIYNANKSKIDTRAAASGLPNNGPGWWIFPGQIFVIPGKYTTTSVTARVPTTTKVTKRTWTAGEPLSTKQPGWYPYQIAAQLVTEAKSRKVESFKNVKLGFEFGFDSEGVSWPTGFDAIVDQSFRIGSSVYEAIQLLVDGGLDVRMSPSYTLDAYDSMGTYRGVNTVKSEQFHLMDKGGTTLTYSISKRTGLKNFLMIDTDKGWRQYSNLASDEKGRSEGGASLGGVSPDKITQAIGEELEELGKKTKTVTTRFHITDGRCPYVDFDLGDIVVAEDAFRRKFDVRIVSMSVREQEGSLTCELKASGEGL